MFAGSNFKFGKREGSIENTKVLQNIGLEVISINLKKQIL